MKLSVEINSCNDCRHQDHSGAFTEGGARPICGHRGACDTTRVSKKEFIKEFPNYKNKINDSCWDYHWIHRVLPHKFIENAKIFEPNRVVTKIPEWCPLKHGGKY